MRRDTIALAAALLAAPAAPARAAEPAMVQCGREYQAARSAGTLNGMDWNGYRAACAARLKAAPTAVEPPAAAAQPAAPIAAAAPAPAPAAPALAAVDPLPPAARAPSPGLAAMHARQKQCGAEWTSGKAALVAQTPGLTWPRYWSQCNARLKAAGR